VENRRKLRQPELPLQTLPRNPAITVRTFPLINSCLKSKTGDGVGLKEKKERDPFDVMRKTRKRATDAEELSDLVGAGGGKKSVSDTSVVDRKKREKIGSD